jgi:magnesium-transporting ATPase (P-type)
VLTAQGAPDSDQHKLLDQACQCAVLANEGYLGRQNGEWAHNGDAVDVALLIMAHKAGYKRPEETSHFPEIDSMPFESERLYSASLSRAHSSKGPSKSCWKCAAPHCSRMVLRRSTRSRSRPRPGSLLPKDIA